MLSLSFKNPGINTWLWEEGKPDITVCVSTSSFILWSISSSPLNLCLCCLAVTHRFLEEYSVWVSRLCRPQSTNMEIPTRGTEKWGSSLQKYAHPLQLVLICNPSFLLGPTSFLNWYVGGKTLWKRIGCCDSRRTSLGFYYQNVSQVFQSLTKTPYKNNQQISASDNPSNRPK